MNMNLSSGYVIRFVLDGSTLLKDNQITRSCISSIHCVLFAVCFYIECQDGDYKTSISIYIAFAACDLFHVEKFLMFSFRVGRTWLLPYL